MPRYHKIEDPDDEYIWAKMIIDRRGGKTITRGTVVLAYKKALELGNMATGPKKLGCFGASYIYPVFVEIGVCGKPHGTERN